MLIKIKFLALLLLISAPALGQDTKRDTINFEFWDYLRINGVFNNTQPGNFIYDTGAGATIIDSAFFARTAHKNLRMDSIKISGLGSTIQKALFTRDSLTFMIGSGVYSSNMNVIYNISKILPGVDCVLGIDIFKNRPYKISYYDRQIVMLQQSDLRRLAAEGYDKVPIVASREGFLVVELTMIIDSSKRKTITTTAHIDTGNPETVDLTPDRALSQKIDEIAPQSLSYNMDAIGVGGGGQMTLIKAQALQIGGQKIKISAFGIIQDSPVGAAHNSNGILGNEFMHHFDIVVDAPDRSIYLRPNTTLYKVARMNYSGFLALRNGGNYVVNGVSHHNIGLKAGDVITHINGKATSELDWWDVELTFTAADAAYNLTFERAGQVKNVDIKNFNYKTIWQ